MEIFSLRLVCSKSWINDFRRVIASLREPIEAHSGCTACRIYREIRTDSTFAVIQEWKSREALDRYIRSREFASILSLIDMSAEAPVIQIVHADTSEGLEAIARIRSNQSVK